MVLEVTLELHTRWALGRTLLLSSNPSPVLFFGVQIQDTRAFQCLLGCGGPGIPHILRQWLFKNYLQEDLLRLAWDLLDSPGTSLLQLPQAAGWGRDARLPD
jgi:hypothetical protein